MFVCIIIPGFVASVHEICNITVVGNCHFGEVFYIRAHYRVLSDPQGPSAFWVQQVSNSLTVNLHIWNLKKIIQKIISRNCLQFNVNSHALWGHASVNVQNNSHSSFNTVCKWTHTMTQTHTNIPLQRRTGQGQCSLPSVWTNPHTSMGEKNKWYTMSEMWERSLREFDSTQFNSSTE